MLSHARRSCSLEVLIDVHAVESLDGLDGLKLLEVHVGLRARIDSAHLARSHLLVALHVETGTVAIGMNCHHRVRRLARTGSHRSVDADAVTHRQLADLQRVSYDRHGPLNKLTGVAAKTVVANNTRNFMMRFLLCISPNVN